MRSFASKPRKVDGPDVKAKALRREANFGF